MKINKAHCFFEQSGTFKNEFIKIGIPAEDYDIQNEFGETDNVIDLFQEIEKAYDGEASIFDKISKDDLVFAFFPCIHFCDAKTLFFKGVHISSKNWSLERLMDFNIDAAKTRERFFILLLKLVAVIGRNNLRLIIENPYNDSGETYLQHNFPKPTIIDKNRSLRGDWFVKPTGYWYFNCTPTQGNSLQPNKDVKVVYNTRDKKAKEKGQCSAARSLIHPDYARNFICDFIIGKEQPNITQLDLFENENN